VGPPPRPPAPPLPPPLFWSEEQLQELELRHAMQKVRVLYLAVLSVYCTVVYCTVVYCTVVYLTAL